MQPGIIAGDEVKHNPGHDAILSSAVWPVIVPVDLAMLMGSGCVISSVKGC